MDITIRNAHPSDLPQIYDIDAEAFSPYGTAESPNVIAARLSAFPEGFLVLEKNGVVLAYASSEKWLSNREPALDEDPSTTHYPLGKIFCITAMAVRRANQRRNLGSALLNRIISIARKHRCEHIVLETTHAKGFYLARGFHTIRERQQNGVIFWTLASS